MRSKLFWDRLNIDQLVTQFVVWLPAFFSAFLLFAAMWGVYRLTRPALARILSRAHLDPALS